MNAQNEILSPQPLLDANGLLANPGWCRHNIYEYNRENISRSIMRLKEWDFYQISNGRIMIQLNIFNISLATAVTFGFVDLHTGRKFDCMTVQLLTPNKNRLNLNSDKPNTTVYSHGKTSIRFETDKNSIKLHFEGVCKGKRVGADFNCFKFPDHESITIATPFKKPGCFFYTNKINCMNTEGRVTYGDETFDFSKEDTFTVLDWGRGVWPYANMWYWANGSCFLNGKIFGFELTWGFGDTSNATETALFYDGKCHKISAVDLVKDPEEGGKWMEPWHFKSEDGRLDLTMTPFYDNYSNLMPLNVFGMKTHQVHGLWNGIVALDSGEILEIKDMYAFCEKVYNKW